SGSMTFSGILPGTYVARAFFNNGSTVQAQSASFTITGTADTTVSTDKASYATTDTVVVSFAHMAGYYLDYVTIAPAGSSATTITQYAYTKGVVTGTKSFSGLAAGTYVARGYFNDGTTIMAESASFSVGP